MWRLCILVLFCTGQYTSHPVTEHISHKEVTEHFAKTKPGEIVRIPASVFTNIQADEEFDFDVTATPSVARLQLSADQQLNKSANLESKSTTSVPVIRANRDDNETSSVLVNTDLAQEDDLSEQLENQSDLYDKLFHAFDGGIVSYFENTTNNPLENLKDFSTWKPVEQQDVDYYGELENSVQGNEFNLYDQLAVESGSEMIHHTILPTHLQTEASIAVEESNDELSPVEESIQEGSPKKESTETPLGEREEKDIGDIYLVKMSTASSQSEVETRIRISPTEPTSVNEEPEAKPNPSENEGHDSTKEKDPVQVPFAEPRNGDREAIAQTGLGFTEASEEVYTPGTLSIVEIHPTSTPDYGDSASLSLEETFTIKLEEVQDPSLLPRDFQSNAEDEFYPEYTEPEPEVYPEIKEPEPEPESEPEPASEPASEHASEPAPKSASEPEPTSEPEPEPESDHDLYGNHEFEVDEEEYFQSGSEFTTDEDEGSETHLHESLQSGFSRQGLDWEGEQEVAGILSSDLYEVVTSNSEILEAQGSVELESEEEDVKTEHFFDPHVQGELEEAREMFIHELEKKYEINLDNVEDRKFENIMEHPMHEENHVHLSLSNPLITLMDVQPHSMRLMIKPKEMHPKTTIKILYERVPRNKPPLMHHLDDPVVESFIMLNQASQEYGLDNLPMGKYIVCAEASVDLNIFQTNCFETLVERLDNNKLQSGVIAVIAVAILIVVFFILFAIYHRINNIRKQRKEKELALKVEKLAAKEAQMKSSNSALAVSFDSGPFEERCIM